MLSAQVWSQDASAPPADAFSQCLHNALSAAGDEVTVRELRARCADLVKGTDAGAASRDANTLERRMAMDLLAGNNPFVLNAYRANYFLPYVYNRRPNEAPFEGTNDSLSELDHGEFDFQLSVKVLLAKGVLFDRGHLFFGYTNRSFWQAYNKEASRAFRDTNHEPELFVTFENDWEVLGFRNVANQVILNHQSNGRGGDLSRSWNRVMVNTLWERENFSMSLKPWRRVRESDSSDDNPDIEFYMGHFEWQGDWRLGGNTLSLMLRNNLRGDNKGAGELRWSFPLNERIRLMVKYFNGYGESLVDYNAYTESIGIGFQFSDWY